MPKFTDDPSHNRLLAALDKSVHAALFAALEPVVLPEGYRCVEANVPIRRVYFPTRGIVTRAAGEQSASPLQLGIYGNDGFSGTSLAYNINTAPCDEIVQLSGLAFRAPTEAFMDALSKAPSTRSLVSHFAYCLSLQVASHASSSAGGDVRSRLCRLLLMCRDRMPNAEISTTHHFLSRTLGVRRASVTAAIHLLEGDRLVKASRGRITIKDRHALIGLAGVGYGFAEGEYERLITSMRRD